MSVEKKILIISKAFYPSNTPRSFRTTELAKEFARQGHEVVVYIPKDEKVHTSFEKEYGITIKDLGANVFKPINFNHPNKLIRAIKRVWRRLLVQLIDYPHAGLLFQVKKRLKHEKNYDLLVSIAVPFAIHWGVAWARTKNNRIAKTWVADCGDPFYLSSHDTFKKLFYFKYLEKWFSRKADYISIPFEGLKKYFFKEFDSKYVVIPQGFNFDEVTVYDKPIDSKLITFGYAGGFMKNSRDPRQFLDYLSTVSIPFQFVVYNKQKQFTDPYEGKLKDKLVVKDYIPRKELLFELSKLDFLVNIEYNPTNQAPSKLIDYSLTGRPILMIKNKEFDKNVINEFLNKNYLNQFKYPNINVFNIKNVSKQFLNLLN